MPRMKTTPRIGKIPATMTPADLIDWRKGHKFSQEDAGNMLGMAKRTYLYLEKGTTRSGFRTPKIPRLVELAIKGLDVELRRVRGLLLERTSQDAAVINGKPLDAGA